jgi:hypothetical protein
MKELELQQRMALRLSEAQWRRQLPCRDAAAMVARVVANGIRECRGVVAVVRGSRSIYHSHRGAGMHAGKTRT